MNTLKIIALASTALVAFATVPYADAASGADTADLRAVKAEPALTSQQHLAAARELEAKAAAVDELVARHEAMARTGGSPKSDGRSMANHCEHLIAQYRADADAYAAQAAEHKRLAAAR